jgi:thiamine-monophosphate kinase
MNEFDIIQQFFNQQAVHRHDVQLGIGDDAAIVSVPPHHQLVITTDTLVEGVHFPVNTSPFDIGYKALAVNLSDLAAMGAEPAWITLSLTLNNPTPDWLRDFSHGLLSLASIHQVSLIGGDLTRGPLSITIEAHGFVPTHQALRRDAAKLDDLIYITHSTGDAALALEYVQQNKTMPDTLKKRLNRPEPQVNIGKKLRSIAHAAIDISDGLLADLSHILKQSKVGAEINIDQIPLSEHLKQLPDKKRALTLALSGGDDYELCFTIAANQVARLDFDCTCIGKITAKRELVLHDRQGHPYQETLRGYQHF